MSVAYDDHIHSAKNALQLAAKELDGEIRGYPTPISGCDAQFNHLIAERNKVRDALNVLQLSVFVATPRTPYAGAGVESR